MNFLFNNLNYIVEFLIVFFTFLFVNMFFNYLIKQNKNDFLLFLNEKHLLNFKKIKNFILIMILIELFYNNLIFKGVNNFISNYINIKIAIKITKIIITFYICSNLIRINELFNIYQRNKFLTPNTSINNYLRVFNFIIIISGSIFIISFLTEIKPINLITSLSAASAIFVLIFRDFILGVLSSIISANSNVARIGDFISLEKHNIKGVVTDISITSVKIKSTDEGIISFPSYWLINDVMKNSWRSNELKIKQVEIEFYIKVSSLSKVDFYDIEEIISKNFYFYKQKNIIISYANDKYNIGLLKCSFFVEFNEVKNFEECKIKIYSKISDYLESKKILLEFNLNKE